jgi:hypothetical protein
VIAAAGDGIDGSTIPLGGGLQSPQRRGPPAGEICRAAANAVDQIVFRLHIGVIARLDRAIQ